ncbi:MAG: hypothetical protein HYV09_18840 [Deltaproteobacteria bacterium]|nr:hypothetical protein [Deltaproteobacteria bacterium]
MSGSNPTPTPDSGPRPLDFPLRLRALAHKDPAAAARALGLDRELQAVARRASTTADERERRRLVLEMMELRVQFDALVATALGRPLPDGSECSALSRVPGVVREQLAKLLGVPLRPEFHPVLERKAEEWIEQGRAFDEIAGEFGFVEAKTLGVREPRGALALTYNGSLVQMSSPKDESGMRRFVYQSIYVNSIPSEGALKLKDPVQVDGRMRSTAMDTSTIRKLRVATKKGVPWERERRTFDRISTILTPPPALLQAVSRHTSWGVASGYVRALGPSQLGPQARDKTRLDDARRAARVELGALLDKLAGASARRDTVEVEVLGLCLHLQTLEVERGRRGYELEDVASFATDRDERLVVEKDVLRLERRGRTPKTFALEAIGDQQIVVGAPVLLLDETGAIVAVLGDVDTIVTR